MWTVIYLIVYLSGFVLCYCILRERDLDAIAARNKAKTRVTKEPLMYTRTDRFNNIVTSLTSWIGIVLIFTNVSLAVFFNYDWRKPVKW